MGPRSKIPSSTNGIKNKAAVSRRLSLECKVLDRLLRCSRNRCREKEKEGEMGPVLLLGQGWNSQVRRALLMVSLTQLPQSRLSRLQQRPPFLTTANSQFSKRPPKISSIRKETVFELTTRREETKINRTKAENYNRNKNKGQILMDLKVFVFFFKEV